MNAIAQGRGVAMFHAYFGLESDPFSLSPDLDFLFTSNAHQEAIAHLVYGLEQSADLILVTGEIGTGKTLALHFLLEQLSASFRPVYITVTTLDFPDLLRLILNRLGERPAPGLPLADLLCAFEERLIETRQGGKKVLLVVDEAQNLSLETLESTRLLLNLARPGGQALQIVLAGQLGLNETLARPELRQLKQRIRIAYELAHLTREETGDYVRHRLEKAGVERPLFKPDALDRIHELSGGVPRLVNHLADGALLAAYVDDAKQVGANHVEDLDPAMRPVGTHEAPAAPVSASSGSTPPPPPTGPSAAAPAAAAAPPAATSPPAPPEQRAARRVRSPDPAAMAHRRPPDHRRSRGFLFAAAVVVVIVLLAVAYVTYSNWGPSPPRAGTRRPAAGPPGAHAVATDPAVAGADRIPELSATPPAERPSAADAAAARPESAAARVPGTAAAPTPADGGDIGYFVHVASFRDESRSYAFGRKLAGMGFADTVETARINGTSWHRVLLGPFAARDEADRTAAVLADSGIIRYHRIVGRETRSGPAPDATRTGARPES